METREKLNADLQSELSRWRDLFENGGSDPNWADGCNLNLVRNHVIFSLKKLEELGKKGEQLDLFSSVQASVDWSVVPPEVSNDYMAQPEKIRADAKATLDALEKSELVAELIAIESALPDDKANRYYHRLTERELDGLRKYIAEDRLIEMRRHRDARYQILCLKQRMERYAKGIQEITENEEDECYEDECV